MDGKTVLHVQGAEGGRPLLRARVGLSRARADRLAREGARGLEREVEDPVLPPPAVLVRRAPRLGRRRCGRRSSRCSSSTASASCSPATITSTSGSSRRTASSTSWSESGGKLREGNIDPRSGLTARGFDTDLSFLVAEIAGDEMFFNAISRHGRGHRLRGDPAAQAESGATVRTPWIRPRGPFPSSSRSWLRARPAASRRPASSRPRRRRASAWRRATSLTRMPTSRRPSSSSLRRLWLPTNAVVPSRTMRAHVQPQVRQLARNQRRRSPCRTLPMTRISTPALRALLQHAQDEVVADLRVVDQQLLPRPLDERRQHLARGLRADDQAIVAGHVGLARRGRPRTACSASLTSFLSVVDDAEAAALLDVELRVVEAEHVERVVDDHHLAVIARQVVGGARDGDPGVEQLQLELAQALLAAAVGVRDERAHDDAARDGRLERLLELGPVEPEDDDVDRSSWPCGWP